MMAIEMVSVKCPECGASMNVESDRKIAFCSYCGSKIILHDENEFTVNINDKAEVKYAETNQMVNLKKMEIAEKSRAAYEKRHSVKMILSIILGAIGIICFFVGYSFDNASGALMVGMVCLLIVLYMWILSKDDDSAVDFGDMAKVPSGVSGYRQKNYQTMEAMFRSAGFVNVTCIGLGDLSIGLLKKPGMVDSITVNGQEVTTGGKKFPKDAKVVISYHSQR